MRRFAGAAAVAVVLLVAAGCGGSDQDGVARVSESYPRALAAGDARAACNAFSPEAQREQSRSAVSFCAFLRETVSKMTAEERRRARAAKAVRIEVEGDRATGYLQYGDCVVTTSESELRRDDSGDWRIQSMGGVGTGNEKLCLNR
jgi:hypothetical protein